MDDALSILGVSEEATPEEIHAAYLKLAKSVHPDAGGSQAEFVRLQAAYESALERCRGGDSPKGRWREERRAAAAPSYEDLKAEAYDRLDREAVECVSSGGHARRSAPVQWYLGDEFKQRVFLVIIAASLAFALRRASTPQVGDADDKGAVRLVDVLSVRAPGQNRADD